MQASNRISRLAQWLLLIVALALVGFGFAYLHAHEAQRMQGAERHRLQALTTVLGDDVASNLDAANRALQRVIADLPSGLQRDPSRTLAALADAMPGIRTLFVLDAEGIVTASSDAQFIGKNFSHQTYFRTVKDHPSPTMLYLSAPFQSMRNDVIMNVSRMVSGARGEFSGLAIATLDPEYFIRIFRAARYAPDVSGSIVHGDGVKLLNFPVNAGIDGRHLNQYASFFRRHLDLGQVDSVLAATLQASGEQRLAASRTIQPAALALDKALVITLSRDLAAIRQPLRREAILYALFHGALVLLCCAGLYWRQSRYAYLQNLSAGRERDRQQADERMQLALRGANLGLWSFDVATAALTLDGNALAILGVMAQDAALDPVFWTGRIHRADLPAYLAARDACVDGSVPDYEVTYRIWHQRGHWTWILARGRVMARDAQGRAISIMGTHFDLTDIKRAEQKVLRSSNELEVIFDNLSEAVLALGRDGTVIHSNRVARDFQALIGPSFSLGQTIDGVDLILPDGQILPHEQWPTSRGLRGDFVKNLEMEIRRRDNGAGLFVDCSTAPILDDTGAIDMLIVTFMDINERRRSHALRDSEARFRTLIEDAPLAIAMLRAGHFIYANPRYRALHDYLDSDNLNGRPWRAMLSNASGALLQAEHDSIALDRPVELMFEAEGLGKDGRLVPVFKTTATVLLADGPATLIFAQDISIQKAAETAMRQALAGAEKANRSKAEFLANMSHEIRSPLNAILGLAYLLERSQLDPDAQDMVRKIRSSGRLLLGIISDILDVSKIEAGHMEIEQAPFRLADVFDNLATAMGMAACDKQIELIIHPLPSGVAMVVGDALRLQQLLLNLTSNAIKFTEAGRVTLQTDLLSRSADQMLLRFCVRDTGIGIAAALQDDVFLAFTQADSSTTRRFGGSGLGLTICRQLVGLMQGEIGVISVPGQGSEFWFTLPLLAISEADVAGSGMVRTPPLLPMTGLAGMRLLVVDDSEINREVAQRILRDEGAVVTLAIDGKAALDWLLGHPDRIDLILMDVQMPVMDGIEATRQLRRLPQFDVIPIIALTAGAFQSQQDAARAAGMTEFVSKPFDVPLMIALIQRLVARRRLNLAPIPSIDARHDALAQLRASPSIAPAPIDVERGLQRWSDLQAYRDYLRRFADSYGDAVDLMHASLALGDRAAAARLAHKLAGVAGNLALPETYHLAHEAEQVLAGGNDPTPVLAQLRQALLQAMVGIDAFAPPVLSAQAPSAGLPVDLARLLLDLMAALDGDDPEPVEPLLAALAQRLPGRQVDAIARCVLGFDFRGAEAATLELAGQLGIGLENTC